MLNSFMSLLANTSPLNNPTLSLRTKPPVGAEEEEEGENTHAPRENAVGRAGQRRVLRRHEVLLREIHAGRQVLLHDLRGLGALAWVCVRQREGGAENERYFLSGRLNKEAWNHIEWSIGHLI